MKHRKLILLLAILSTFFAVATQGLIFLPRSTYLMGFGMSANTYGKLLGASAIVMVVIQMVLGRWSDEGKNRKRHIMLIAMAFNLTAQILFVLTQNLYLLGLGLLFGIVGFGLFLNMARALAASVSDPRNISSTIAAIQIACSVAFGIFSLAYGYIITWLNYRSLFIVATVFCVLAFLSVVLSLLMADVDTAHSQPRQNTKFTLKDFVSFPQETLVCMALFLFYNISQMGGFNYVLYYFKDVGGVSDIKAAWILFMAAMLEIPLVYLVGKYCDRYRKEWITILMGLISASRWLLMTMGWHVNWFFVFHSMQGLAVAMINVSLMAMILERVPQNRKGTALGVIGALMGIASSAGPSVMGWIIARASIQTAFHFVGYLGMVPTALFAVYVLFRQKKEPQKAERMTLERS